LVHGIMSNARDTFGTPGHIFQQPKTDSMCSFLLDQGYKPGQTLFWFSYPSLKPLLASARFLQNKIAHVQRVTGRDQVDLLTFSLGGIIGKYLAVSPLYRGEIAKMIMIAPPFLGSPKANLYKTSFDKSKSDLLFPGDSRAFTPQILGANHPLLLELAKRPFPPKIKTVVIAMKIIIGEKRDLRSCYHRYIASWVGEGDQTVPVKSTHIDVNQHYVVASNYSRGRTHGFLPNHAEIKRLVIKELNNDSVPEISFNK
jgi:hypothetical protein